MTNSAPLPFTKYGDKGCTMLADCSKDQKASARVQVIGDIDELNSSIGIIRENYRQIGSPSHLVTIEAEIEKDLKHLQNLLFVAGTDVATPIESETCFRIKEKHIEWIEERITSYHHRLDPLKNFVLPNNRYHLARSIARRAERSYWALAAFADDSVLTECGVFLNRISDFLFTVARLISKDEIWDQDVL